MRSRRVALATAVVLLAGLFTATASRADPDVSDEDVQAARSAVTDAAAAVAVVELKLAELSASLDAAWVAVAVAGEEYTRALVEQDAAQTRADEAAERSELAAQEVQAARSELGRIAQEAYRSGGSLDSAVVLLAADGFEDYVARSAALERMGAHAERTVQRFRASDLVARTLSGRADAAAQEAREAASSAEEALAEAHRLQTVAEEQVLAAEVQREALVAELASLRRTSAAVERARQRAIEAERQSRSDAGGGGSQPNPTSGDPYGLLGTGSQRGSAAQGEAAVAWALQQVGKPYVYGAAGPNAFDCSGLTMRAWGVAGVSLNRSSRDQYRQVYKITYGSLRPGDLIFFGTDPGDPGSVYHVSMYIGGGQIVEASRPGVPLRVASMRWTDTMPYAGRP